MPHGPDHVPRGTIKGWVFLSFAFKAGDILLCTDPLSPKSLVIRAGTRKDGKIPRFSHAAICVDGPLFIDASYPSVAQIHIDRIGNIRSLKNVRVLRLNGFEQNGVQRASEAADHARKYKGMDFSALAAIESVIPKWNARMGRRTFCSYVVSAAYLSAGINVTVDPQDPESRGKPPHRTTPADIERSKRFRDVTKKVTAPAIFFPGAAPHEWIDRPLSVSPARRTNAVYEHVAQKASDFLKSHGRAAVNGFGEVILTLRQSRHEPWFEELDALVATYLDKGIMPLIDGIPSLDGEERERQREDTARLFRKADPGTLSMAIATALTQLWIKQKIIRERESAYQTLRSESEEFGGRTSSIRTEIEMKVLFMIHIEYTQLYGDLMMYRGVATERDFPTLVDKIDEALRSWNVTTRRLH